MRVQVANCARKSFSLIIELLFCAAWTSLFYFNSVRVKVPHICLGREETTGIRDWLS